MNHFHDLNLEYLRSLNSILTTKSATKSARELGVTQSAVSHSLKRLREHLDDELVFRQGNQLELTAKAQAMQIPLRNWLEQLEGILNVEEFDPTTSTKVFYIATTDIFEHLFASELVKILQKEAPHIQLRFLRWQYASIASWIDNSQIDFGIGVSTFDEPFILQRVLYEDTFLSVARKGHPILKGKQTLEKFLSFPHAMTGSGDGRGAVDNYLERLNRKRDLLYTFNSFAGAPALIENSECILTAPGRFLKHIAKRHKIEIFKTPLDMRPFSLKLYWGKKNQNDAANQWMREILYKVTGL